MFEYEKQYLDKGYNFIGGMDEAGRGPLAGPVAVACVVMPLEKDKIIEGVNDSKKLTPKKREELYAKITDLALDYSITFIDEKTIDLINILQATKLGMKSCVEKIKLPLDVVLVDAVNKLDINVEYLPIIKGDSLSYSIACASILAKVSRDRLMDDLDKKYPEYEFYQHKGYGTPKHIELLKKYGPCEIHRNSFIKNFVVRR